MFSALNLTTSFFKNTTTYRLKVTKKGPSGPIRGHIRQTSIVINSILEVDGDAI